MSECVSGPPTLTSFYRACIVLFVLLVINTAKCVAYGSSPVSTHCKRTLWKLSESFESRSRADRPQQPSDSSLAHHPQIFDARDYIVEISSGGEEKQLVDEVYISGRRRGRDRL